MSTMAAEIRPSVEDLPDYDLETDEKNDDDSQSPLKKVFSCDVCNIQVTSCNVLKRHKEGRKHMMRLERQGKSFVCELCDVTANSQSQLEAHLRSSKHKNRQTRKESATKLSVRNSLIFLFGLTCIIVNFVILFKMIM